jgi:hypothetical protein
MIRPSQKNAKDGACSVSNFVAQQSCHPERSEGRLSLFIESGQCLWVRFTGGHFLGHRGSIRLAKLVSRSREFLEFQAKSRLAIAIYGEVT